jgi:hypothetical protein
MLNPDCTAIHGKLKSIAVDRHSQHSCTLHLLQANKQQATVFTLGKVYSAADLLALQTQLYRFQCWLEYQSKSRTQSTQTWILKADGVT